MMWALIAQLLLGPSLALRLNSQFNDAESATKSTEGKHPFSSRLIVHVGPHKTGTTSFQNLVTQNKQLLLNKFGISAMASDNPKSGAIFANTLEKMVGNEYDETHVNEAEFQQQLHRMRDVLSTSGSTALLSAERFDSMKVDGWRYFKSMVEADMSFVIFHRDAFSWVRSMWSEDNKGRTDPQSFQNYSSKFRGEGFGPVHSDMSVLRELEQIYPKSSIHTASLDLLKEEGESVASFVVCNVSAGLIDSSWTECNAAIRAIPVLSDRVNISPPPIAIDVVRVARSMYEQKKQKIGECKHPFTLTAAFLEASLFEFSELPQYCIRSSSYQEGYFDRMNDAWYARTGTRRPRAPPDNTFCLLDEDRLTQEQRQFIEKLLPTC